MRTSLERFSILFFLYLAASYAIFLSTSFTIAAGIFYIFLLGPFFLILAIYSGVLFFTKRHHTVYLPANYILYGLGMFQVLAILCSPTSCYGFKQGEACYSFIQTHYINLFTDKNLMQVDTGVAHWPLVNSLFPIFLAIYSVGLLLVLLKLRIYRPAE